METDNSAAARDLDQSGGDHLPNVVGAELLRRYLFELLSTKRRILIIGLGVSALASAKRLLHDGYLVVICERRSPYEPELKRRYADAVRELEALGVEMRFNVDGEELIPILSQIGLVVLSPGVSNESAVIGTISRSKLRYVSELELNLALDLNKSIVVSGTNGKSTTARIIGEILKAAQRTELVVTASSYQLDNSLSLKPDVSVLLNITDNHLERYGSLERYARVKGRVLALQDREDLCVVNADDGLVLERASLSQARLAVFASKDKESLKRIAPRWAFVESDREISVSLELASEERYELSDFALVGSHNRLNLAAAILTTRVLGVDSATIQGVISSIRAEPHRLERLLAVGGVPVWNDSKSTTVAATVAGFNGVRQALPGHHIVLVVGGLSKAGAWEPLVQQVNSDRRGKVICYGRDAGLIAGHFKAGGLHVSTAISLAPAVELAIKLASEHKGEIAILFSPGCSSFDEFSDYRRRGEEFKRLIQAAN